jgi:hypothetical protein
MESIRITLHYNSLVCFIVKNTSMYEPMSKSYVEEIHLFLHRLQSVTTLRGVLQGARRRLREPRINFLLIRICLMAATTKMAVLVNFYQTTRRYNPEEPSSFWLIIRALCYLHRK